MRALSTLDVFTDQLRDSLSVSGAPVAVTSDAFGTVALRSSALRARAGCPFPPRRMRVATEIREYAVCGAAMAHCQSRMLVAVVLHDIVAHALWKRIEASATAEEVDHMPRCLLVAAILEGPEIIVSHHFDLLV
jgi:hypothetical protein